jgi:adenine-specific DNA-methyltransferase
VLQENIIYAVSRSGHPTTVRLSTSNGPEFPRRKARIVPYSEVVRPDDPDLLIHLPMTPGDDEVVRKIAGLRHSLQDLGITVSTGPVVEFRLRDFIRQQPVGASVPLLYPSHFRNGKLVWPRLDGRKPNAIVNSDETRQWLMPCGYYTNTRRFSSKEEKRRIVAAVLDPDELDGTLVGIENHLNVFHQDGHGLDPAVASGLSAYLNSRLVDQYFRLFNGHTQVNASDLRALRYPALSELRALGKKLNGSQPSQVMLDKWVAAVVLRCRTAA